MSLTPSPPFVPGASPLLGNHGLPCLCFFPWTLESKLILVLARRVLSPPGHLLARHGVSNHYTLVESLETTSCLEPESPTGGELYPSKAPLSGSSLSPAPSSCVCFLHTQMQLPCSLGHKAPLESEETAKVFPESKWYRYTAM